MSAPTAWRRRLLLALGLVIALGAPGAYAVYRLRPEWLFAAGVLSVRDHPLRRGYEREVAALKERADELRRQGRSEEEIARTLYEERRAIGIRYKDLTPEPLRQRIYEINRQRYGDPFGPSFEYLVKKHTREGRTDWTAIIESAARTNPDVDRLLRGP